MKPYFDDGQITIYHGDCREILPLLPSVDLVLTDPPYGIAYDSTHKKFKGGVVRDPCGWDKEPFDPSPILSVRSAHIIWGGNCFASRLPDSPGWLSWVKIGQNGKKIRQAEMELAWTDCINRSQSFRWNWIGAGMEGEGNAVYGGIIHPTQKPVALMKWCLSLLPAALSVLDPFMGSGTTLRAAKDLGLKAIGIEIEERYCEIAVRRLAQSVLSFEPPQERERVTG